MTADEAREQLEAAIRREATYMEPHTGRYKCAITEGAIGLILACADRHAQAVAIEAMDVYEGRERLAAARAEYSPATMPGMPGGGGQRTGRTTCTP
jgi:hypothetical protein